MSDESKVKKSKKAITLMIGEKFYKSPEMIAVVGGRNAGDTNISAWKALSESGVIQNFPPHTVVCVLKDGKPFKQMTKENLEIGLTLVNDLVNMRKLELELKQKLSDLQISFVTVKAPDFSAENLQAEFAEFVPSKGKKVS